MEAHLLSQFRGLRLGVLGLAALTVAIAQAQETIQFPSGDGLGITAELYRRGGPELPFIVLFHQAGWSRGEYLEIAPRLNRLGFSCMAVDLRSGKSVNGVENQTAARARAAGKGTSYLDALPDIVASLEYARKRYAKSELVAWGSSYSAALVLKVAGDRHGLVDGVLAFSPGEYFVSLGKPADWIRSSAPKIKVPVFVTSARRERDAGSGILEAVGSALKVSYLPDTEGNHGSRALWSQFDDSPGYWRAVEGFLPKTLAD